MEPVVTVSEGEWSSLSGIYTSEEADFMAQLLGNINGDSQFNIEIDQQESPNADFPCTHWSVQQSSNLNIPRIYGTESPFYSSNFGNPNINCFFPTSSYDAGNGSLNFSSSYHVSGKSGPILAASDGSIPMDFCAGTETGNDSTTDVGRNDFLNQEMNECNAEELSASLAKRSMQLKEESEIPGQEPAAEEISNVCISSHSSKKRSRSIPNEQKMKRNITSRKSLNDLSSQYQEDGNGNGHGNGQSSSTCCSEEDTGASQEQIGGVTSTWKEPAPLNANGKTRASRRSATDPQSLYARKRRERINERLRILQNLVPNGTKVDISTMLEEAAHYVKFLQLQIKLLSSDDLWMYAPIAYNGMDIGFDFKINSPR